MQDINRIYHNNIGIAFQWKKDVQKGNTDCIQMVFRNTGFYLTYSEIKEFYNKVKVDYHFTDSELQPEKIQKAVNLSVTKYCGVMEMFRQFSDVEIEIHLHNI